MADLEKLPPFHNLTRNGRDLLGQGLVCNEYAPATALLHKGQHVSGAYFVLEGRLRVYSLAPSGAEATLYCVNPGEACVLALNALFNDLLYPAWAETESCAKVGFIQGAIFRKLFESEPCIQDVTVRALSTIVFRLMDELEQVHSFKLEHRLANLILLRASADGLLRMTQQQMADHLGTTREVIARLMREFVARKYVATQRGRIIVKNAAGLTSLVTPSPGSQA